MKKVNGARTRVIALGIAIYVGEDANGRYGNASGRPCSCQYRVNGPTQAVSPIKERRGLESLQFTTDKAVPD
jgi:hypothetical protein